MLAIPTRSDMRHVGRISGLLYLIYSARAPRTPPPRPAKSCSQQLSYARRRRSSASRPSTRALALRRAPSAGAPSSLLRFSRLRLTLHGTQLRQHMASSPGSPLASGRPCTKFASVGASTFRHRHDSMRSALAWFPSSLFMLAAASCTLARMRGSVTTSRMASRNAGSSGTGDVNTRPKPQCWTR